MALLDGRFTEPDEAEALRAWHARYQEIMNSDLSALEALRALKALGPMPGYIPADGED